ncbi:MAG: hypothetical protein KF691_03375 [Phycisphaeraceae bacterium]|nr:hypothetical protein [Phycisphaeraceae bacterium]
MNGSNGTTDRRPATPGYLKGIDSPKEAREFLQGLRLRVQVLAQQAGAKKPDRESCHEQLRRLKDDLREWMRQMDARCRDGTDTDLERRLLRHAIRGCLLQIRVRVNSRPGRSWSNDLYSAEVDVLWAELQLDRWEERNENPAS